VEGAPLNNGKLNLLEFGPLKRLLGTGIYPGLFKALNLFLFVFVLYFLLTRPGPIENNWGLKLLWIVWWPLLVPLTFLFARFWCGICPVRFAVSSTGARKPGHGVYAWFKDRGPYISVMLFATITGVDQFYPFAVDPIASAVLLLSVFALFLFFEKVMGGWIWCRFLCPMSVMLRAYSALSPLEVRADAKTCAEKCGNGNCVIRMKKQVVCVSPAELKSNSMCDLCMECVKECPHGSIKLNLRRDFEELWLGQTGGAAAFFAFIMLGAVVAENLEVMDAWAVFRRGFSWAGSPNAVGLSNFMVLAIALAACAALYKLGTMLAGNTAMRYAAGLLPLSLFALVANKMFFVSSTAMFLLNSPSQLPVFNQPTLSAIQVVTVLAGLAGTLFTSMKIHGNEKNRAALCFTLAVAAVFSLIFVWQSILTKTYSSIC
jgi:polyferredoxin